jgi:hypothetical protein
MEALCHEDLHLEVSSRKGPISYGFAIIIESSASELIDFGMLYESKLRVPKLEFQICPVRYMSFPFHADAHR